MARVETSPITADDTGPAARFLHTELNSAVSVARWQALLQPSWPDAGPNRGFQLTVDGEVVGVYAAVYARRETSTAPLTTCNLAAFCVREEYRMHSLKLVRALLAQPGHVFTDFSPSGNVIAMNERLGMRTLDGTTRLVVNAPRPAPRGVRLAEDPAALRSVLRGGDADVYRDHADASAARHLLVQRGSDYAYLVFRATSRKRLRLFAAPLYVGGDGLLERGLGRRPVTDPAASPSAVHSRRAPDPRLHRRAGSRTRAPAPEDGARGRGRRRRGLSLQRARTAGLVMCRGQRAARHRLSDRELRVDEVGERADALDQLGSELVVVDHDVETVLERADERDDAEGVEFRGVRPICAVSGVSSSGCCVRSSASMSTSCTAFRVSVAMGSPGSDRGVRPAPRRVPGVRGRRWGWR
ncbi:hypothetical protein [Microbacterium aurum]